MKKNNLRHIKVLFITGRFGVGGKERQMTEIMSALPANYEMYFLVREGDAYYKDKIAKRLKGFYSLQRSNFGPGDFFKIFKIINEIDPDVLFIWSNIASHLCLLIKVFTGKKFLLINSSIRNAPVRRSLWQILESYFYNLYPYVVSNSEAGLKAYNQLGKPGRYIMPNGIDLSRFPLAERPRQKNKLDVTDEFVVSMAARMEKAKDYSSLIKAARICINRDKSIVFYLAGDGHLRPNLEREAKDMGLEAKVKFLGEQKDIENLFLGSDISVLLSTNGESLSNSVLESMAAGVPVLASDFPGNRQVIRDGYTGYLIKGNQPELLAEKILELKIKPNLRQSMSQNCRLLVEKDFSLMKTVDIFEQIIGQVLDNGKNK